MPAGYTLLRKNHYPLTLTTLGLLLSLVLGYSTSVLAGPWSDLEEHYTVFDAPNATLTYAANINDRGIVTGNAP